MRKALFLIILFLQCSLLKAQGPSRFAGEIENFHKMDKNSFPPSGCVVFTGSSSIRFWKTLENDFRDYCVLNRGFGGSEISDVNYYFDDVVTEYKPQMVVLYAGDNDLAAGKTPENVFNDFKIFLDKMISISGPVPLIYISVKPSPSRWHLKDSSLKLNMLISQYCQNRENVIFVNIFEDMLGANGRPISELYIQDSLHMSGKGYELWQRKITPYLLKYYDAGKTSQQKK
jgi:hypothetical protein